MPTLEWIGKSAVVNHHREVPTHLLHCDPARSVGDPEAGNLLIQGDNLLALKALLPYYAGQVKCIYIDPPYNTGNEGWVYNDNVNSPEMRKWLGQVVGKEADDLSRHDKWLCMMYPRLALLREFLREDGIIFVSLDDNEAAHMKLLLDEIFGSRCFIQQIIWKNKYGPGAGTRGFGNVHEYIFCYGRSPIESIEAGLSAEDAAKYKARDEHFETRGGYITQPLATKSKDDRPNLVYPLDYRGNEIWPDKQWIWSKERLEATIAKNGVVFKKSKEGKWSVRFKQYLRDDSGKMRMAKPISIMLGPFNQDGSAEIEEMFGSRVFQNTKPSALVKYLSTMTVNDDGSDNYLVFDSFAGSGTTGHAVLVANAADGGSRRFILVEMEPEIATNVTAQRLTKAIKGYTDPKGKVVDGLGGGFRYCTLGPALFDQYGLINDVVKFPDLALHVYFAETGSPLPKKASGKTPLIGTFEERAIYLLYNGILGDRSPDGGNVLTGAVLDALPEAPDGISQRVVYGEGTRLGEARLQREGIVFKQIPYGLGGG